jgi:hypothetical protein
MDNSVSDNIMHERIEKFNQFVMSQNIEKIPLGLFSGKMGICIYFYHQARLTNNKEYKKFAKKLLDLIYCQIHPEMPVDIENGLTGICLGINYLIDEKFLSGDANYVLKDLDDKIFQHFCFNHLSGHISNNESLIAILEISLYFSLRLKNKKLPANERYIFSDILIKAINHIDNHSSFIEKLSEPSMFSINDYSLPCYLYFLAQVYQLDIYNYKIDKIFENLTNKLKSTYPLLLSNRLFLSAGMKSVEKLKMGCDWKKHILLLEKDINFSSILRDEFKNKNIFPKDGLSSLYFLMKNSGAINAEHRAGITHKMATSDVWEEFLDNPAELKYKIGLVTGFSGIILAYQEIQNNK